jgi:hypothetical protein
MWPHGHNDKLFDGQLSPSLSTPPLSFAHSLCPFLIVASHLGSQGHFQSIVSALCKKAGRGSFYKRKKMTYKRKSLEYFWKKYFYVKTILKS